jgi:hypothetical protein
MPKPFNFFVPIGALIVSTDHPPMNELVAPGSGVLVRPSRTSSYGG